MKHAHSTSSSSLGLTFVTALLAAYCIFLHYRISVLGDIVHAITADHVAGAHMGAAAVSSSAHISKAFEQSYRPMHFGKSPEPSGGPVIVTFADSQKEEINNLRNRGVKYGGKDEPEHLGGFTERDNMTISYNTWNYMMGPLGVRSVMDMGCGRGYSASYFHEKGARTLCIEGSSDAIKQSLLPRSAIVQHDYTRGPWWPQDTFDVLWTTEFMEHIAHQHMQNYLPTMHKAALIFMTSSAVGGWHHVEVQPKEWWVAKMESQGFLYSAELTGIVRAVARAESMWNRRHIFKDSTTSMVVFTAMNVFINPAVASLPQHKHLIAGHGCYSGVFVNQDGGKPCEGVDALTPEFQSILSCKKKIDPNYPGDSEQDWKERMWDCEKNPLGPKIQQL